MAYTIRDFSIISTECDSMLFFSSSYQKSVTDAINRIMREYEASHPNYEFKEYTLNLTCHKSYIEIVNERVEPDIQLQEILA